MASEAFQRVLAHIERRYGAPADAPIDDADFVAASRAANEGYADVDGIAPALAPTTRVVPVAAGGVPAEWVLTPETRPDQRLLWIHGGGWIACAPVDYRNITETLARETGAAVLAIDYRLAPEHPYPAGLDDCFAAYRWLRANGPDGAGAARVQWVAGDSAGGNLTLALLLRLKAAGAPLPAAAATLGAVTDLTGACREDVVLPAPDPMISAEGVHAMARLYAQGKTPLGDPFVSPLYGELAGLPPIRMHVGEREVLIEDTRKFAARARAAGVQVEAKVWPEMIHVFEGFCHMLPEGRRSLAEIGAFLRAHG